MSAVGAVLLAASVLCAVAVLALAAVSCHRRGHVSCLQVGCVLASVANLALVASVT